MADRKLIVIKHAKAAPTEGALPQNWSLGDEGRAGAQRLAERLRELAPAMVFCSDEPKAQQTAEILAAAFGLSATTDPALREHERDNVALMPSREFISLMALFFKQKNRLVLGQETASEVTRRIVGAVDRLLVDHPKGNVAVVTHGTVLALLLAERAQRDPFLSWRNMGQPSYALFDVPSWELREVVERV